MPPERIAEVVGYVLDHFDAKTDARSGLHPRRQARPRASTRCSPSPPSRRSRLYYDEFATQQAARKAADPSYQPLEGRHDLLLRRERGGRGGGILGDEALDAEALDDSSRDFLERAIGDYNAMFGTTYDTSAAKFENYYKDLARA